MLLFEEQLLLQDFLCSHKEHGLSFFINRKYITAPKITIIIISRNASVKVKDKLFKKLCIINFQNYIQLHLKPMQLQFGTKLLLTLIL